ncbi:hypothetical protein [Leptospira gomenensis]|nr:hypothetical protein [Leptospira gomenensis]
MKIEATTVLKATTRASFHILANVLFFSLLGLTLNLILLAFLFPEMKSLTSNIGSMPIARAGGIGAVIALVVIVFELWPVTLIVLCFAVVFPGLHFLYGKKRGIDKALYSFALNENLELVSGYLSEKLETAIRKRAESDRSSGKNFSLAEQIRNLPYYLSKLEDLPSPFRFLVARFSKKLKLDSLLNEVGDGIQDKENPSSEELQKVLSRSVRILVRESVSPPSFAGWFYLCGIDLGVFVLLKTFL